MSASVSELKEEEVDIEERVKGLGLVGKSQPRVLSSWIMRRRIMASGTRAPERIVEAALMPGELLGLIIGEGMDWRT